jgi:hypothetical protein
MTFSGEVQKFSGEVQNDLRGGAHLEPSHTSPQSPAMRSSKNNPFLIECYHRQKLEYPEKNSTEQLCHDRIEIINRV